MNIKKIVEKLYPFDYSIAGKGNDLAIKEFKKFLPFKVYSFTTGKSYNGWKIPHSWKLKKGLIKDGSKVIFDAKKSLFGVPVQSPSFSGIVSYKKLLKHIYTSKNKNNATPYNWSGLYRNQRPIWGFCMPASQLVKLKKKNYKVEIKTEIKKSKMKVLEYTLRGRNANTIIINAHNCHPFQANDDISGCAIGIKLFQELKKIKNRKFTYTLLIAPELYGPIFWLNKINKSRIKNLDYSILLKSVGNNNSIKLQHSVLKNTEIDNSALRALINSREKYTIGNFRTIYGNDEIVFDSPGYNIHTISLTRSPFPEYHTDLDTPKIISQKKLSKTFSILKFIINDLEKKIRFKNNFKGVIALSNKKFKLYLNAESPGIDKKKYTTTKKNWNLLMNNLPSFIDQKKSVDEIARYHNLPYKQVLSYCLKWENKNLIKKY